ncbi:MAG: acyl-CoA carboxylase subunit beta [Eubacterium sp.]
MSTIAKVSARQRIEDILDDNSFVEIGGLVSARNTDFNLQAKCAPSDGVITGYGVIDNVLVYVYSQDAEVLGGSVGEMHAKKIASLYDMAIKMGAPVIGIIDSTGLRLQEATDSLYAFGELYLKQTMASGVIPQITAIYGNCGGGFALFPALTDFTFMSSDNAKLFINSPNSIDSNNEGKCNTAGAEFNSCEAGNVHFTGSDEEIASEIRKLISILPSNNEDDMSYDECLDNLNRACDGIDKYVEDPKYILTSVSDNNFFMEVKQNYAKDMVTGFIRLNGVTIGAVANRTNVIDENGEKIEEFDSMLTFKGCEKAAEFVEFCDSFNIPLLTITNVKGFKATMCQEKRVAKAAAKLVYAFANATVPKVNLITGKALGSASVTMNCKAIGADLVYAWPTAEIGMMDADNAVKIMYADEIAQVEDKVSFIAEKAAEYDEKQQSVEAAARRGYVDFILSPADTRKYLIGAFEMLFTKREGRPLKKHGTV